MRRVIWMAAVLLLWGPTAGAAQEATPLVKLMEVRAQEGGLTRRFFGHVVAKETVDLAFQVGGQVFDLPVIEGQPVAKGGLIAQLDLEPFELALDQAMAQKDQADRTLERLERLQGSTVSQVSVDDAKTQAELSAIEVRNAERSLELAKLTAPFDALVASRNVARFATISAGSPVVRIHDMSELRVEIDVPEVLFQRAGSDPEVDLWAVFPAIDDRFALTAREFNAETSGVGQTFRITLGMAPPEDNVILPGSSVTVLATLYDGAAPLPEIPGSAVVTGNDGSAYVMAFAPAGAEEGTVTRQQIEIAPSPRGTIEVLSGLEDGQEIVASGAAMLKDGAKVRRFTGFAN